MKQRDRIAIAMMAPDMPPPPIHNPRNLLGRAPAEEGISQEMIDAMSRKGAGLIGEPGYAEWDMIPAANPPLAEQAMPVPQVALPPTIMGEQPPNWATRGGEEPFLNYTRGDEEDT